MSVKEAPVRPYNASTILAMMLRWILLEPLAGMVR